MEKMERTYFKYEQFEDLEPDVEIYGDPDKLISAALALLKVVIDQYPDKYRMAEYMAEYLFKSLMNGTLDPDGALVGYRRYRFWRKAVDLLKGVVFMFGIFFLLALFLNKTAKVFG